MEHNLQAGLNSAKSYELEGKNLHALQVYQKLIEEFPESETVIMRTVKLYEKMNNVTAAVQLLMTFLESNPENEKIRLFLSNFLIQHKLFEDAVESLNLIDKEKNNYGYYLCGMANLSMEEYDIAKLNFLEFADRNKGSEILPDVLINIAQSCIGLKQFDEGIEYCLKSEELFSLSSQLYFTLAKLYYYKKMHYHAVECIEKAILIDSGDNELKDWAGRILCKTGNFKKAEYYLKEYVSMNDSNSFVFSLLGMSCFYQKKFDEAVLYFDKSLTLDPLNLIAIEGKKQCALV